MRKIEDVEVPIAFEDVFNWLKTCPYLMSLWAISATVQAWNDVLFFNNSTSLYESMATEYKDNRVRITLKPTTDYSETYTINAYRPYSENADSFNIDAFNRTRQVCNWIIEQQNNAELFEVDGKPVYAVELLTPSPMMRGTDADNSLIGYYISIRVHMENPAKRADYYVYSAD